MTSKNVEILNRRFGETLGFPDGVHPRFAWMWSADVNRHFRPDPVSDFTRHCLAERIGKRWLLCQWRPTELTADQWWNTYRGRVPYPGKGEYKPHLETALPLGMEPTPELTYGYARTLREQMDRVYTESEFHDEAVRDQQRAETEFYESVADWEAPSFRHGWEPGTRGGPVSFGGI